MRVAVGCQVFLSCGGWLQFRFSTLVPRAGVLFPGSAGIVHEPRGLMILPDASFKLKTLFMRVTPRGSVDDLFFFRYLIFSWAGTPADKSTTFESSAP